MKQILAILFITVVLVGTLAVLSAKVQADAANKQFAGPQQAALAVAATRVKIVQADLDAAVVEEQYYAKEFTRAAKLSQTGAIPDADYHLAWKNCHSARHKLAKARARLEEAKAMVEYVRVTGDTDKSLTLP